MVKTSRTPVSTAQLRPLNAPRPLRVEAGPEGAPRAIYGKGRLEVSAIRDQWRVDDEWWRSQISRHYYQAILEDGRCITLYRDLVTQRWYQQNY